MAWQTWMGIPKWFWMPPKNKKRARAVTYRNALCVGHVFKRQSGRSHAWYDCCCCCCLYYTFSFIWMCSFTYIFFGVRRTPGGSGAYATTTTTPIDRQYKQVLSIPSCRAEHTQFDAWATAMWAHHKSEVNTFASIGTHTHTQQNKITFIDERACPIQHDVGGYTEHIHIKWIYYIQIQKGLAHLTVTPPKHLSIRLEGLADNRIVVSHDKWLWWWCDDGCARECGKDAYPFFY